MIAEVFYSNAGTLVLKFNVLVVMLAFKLCFQQGIGGTVMLWSES